MQRLVVVRQLEELIFGHVEHHIDVVHIFELELLTRREYTEKLSC